MENFFTHFALASPLFMLVLLGYGLGRSKRWPASVSESLTRFSYVVAMPAMLFKLMSGVSSMPPVDSRLLLAFSGGCLIVFVIGRLIAYSVFQLDGIQQSVFALGGVFSNNVLLGLAIAKTTLGDAAVPVVSMVIVFNALILWTLVTVSIEWARHGELSVNGFGKTARGVLTNPIVASILLGTLWSFTGATVPTMIDVPMGMLAHAAVPMSLVALGMSLAEYPIADGITQSLTISAIKLGLQPLVVWLLAKALGLPPLETKVVTLLAAVAMGVNVYVMAQQFKSLQGPIAAGLVMTTVLSSLTVPLVLALL